MDRVIEHRLRDDEVRKSVTTLVKDYLELGLNNVEYWTGEWDYAHDMLMSYAAMDKEDFEKLVKGHPKRFILPMTATQLTTMATFIAQVLFGDDRPHKVEGRGPEDEVPAEHVNTLLKWNAEQQPTYLLGYLWVLDALTYNRGIFYNSWQPIWRPVREQVLTEIPGEFDENGEPAVYWQMRTRSRAIGGFCKLELVSPYDWFCDPGVPLHKFQEGRFAGHRFRIAHAELERRSKLPSDDPAYVMPSAVANLRDRKRPGSFASNLGGAGFNRSEGKMSRSAYERQRTSGPLTGETANHADKGMIECVELWVKLRPRDYGFYDGDETVVFQIILGAGEVVLAVNESTYDHGMFPYSVGEGRPSGHYQHSPSWAYMLKGLQDHVDYLKNRHQEALQRTIGNVFIVDPDKVDTEDFMNPDKEGMLIELKPGASGDMNSAIKQVAIKDLTEHFPSEAQMFMNFAENVTGANNYMQGAPGVSGSATEFAGTQQMAAGRMSSVARLLSVQGVTPQTRQIVSMFQQFLEEPQRVRYAPDPMSSPETMTGMTSLEISADTIQGEFDFIPTDGTLPTGDAKQVAAISALLQSAAAFPQVFTPAPGNLDPKALIMAGARAAGLKDLERYKYTEDSFNQGVQAEVQGQTGIVPDVEPGQFPPEDGGQGIPFNTPGPAASDPSVDALPFPQIDSVGPPQVRPMNF